jgi:hypothetical protein
MTTGTKRTREEHFATFGEIAELIRRFESGELPRPQWTHRAHLTVAGWYLLCHPEPLAVRRIREGIRHYNRAQGIIATPTTGYHETLTLFWARMVRDYLFAADSDSSLVALINGVIEQYADKHLPLEYYSRERLFSPEARRDWVEPDLKPLPG